MKEVAEVVLKFTEIDGHLGAHGQFERACAQSAGITRARRSTVGVQMAVEQVVMTPDMPMLSSVPDRCP
ncbi:hypothetical protein [Sciscionella marina]|uniref:hypothetical protein n=1 Tax=Sciscionella marina TaxID=508770 RepID=UPI0003785975|nr:hypothetical protein [Sciscionella marina]